MNVTKIEQLPAVQAAGIADRNNGGRYSAYQKLTERPIPLVVLTPR